MSASAAKSRSRRAAKPPAGQGEARVDPPAVLGTRAERRVRMSFRAHDDLPRADAPIRSDLSALAIRGASVFVANDEFPAVERLTRDADGGYGDHRRFHLDQIFDLPAGADGEMDIEGLSATDDYLWVVGSHSLVRKKPEPDERDHEQALERLTRIERQPNRHLLGRVPLIEDGEGRYRLAATEQPAKKGRARQAACLPLGAKSGGLSKLLRGDPHLDGFLNIPSKENGFDIEGLAVRGARVFLGLRGPVLRGYAVVLELDLKETRRGRLKPRRLNGKRRYRKHFLDLAGFGIRDLCFDGDDLLILAGPTMDLDWPVTIYRWRGCLDGEGDRVVGSKALSEVLTLPYGEVDETAEGLDLLPGTGERREVLVVYDPPGRARRHDDGAGVDADVFRL